MVDYIIEVVLLFDEVYVFVLCVLMYYGMFDVYVCVIVNVIMQGQCDECYLYGVYWLFVCVWLLKKGKVDL